MGTIGKWTAQNNKQEGLWIMNYGTGDYWNLVKNGEAVRVDPGWPGCVFITEYNKAILCWSHLGLYETYEGFYVISSAAVVLAVTEMEAYLKDYDDLFSDLL
ncbi:hypothetical protein J6590_011932 [Homalodisca vitripennis]|nr:hypothetical protein J6590_011932 [Homalodisca vitripennis]